MIPVHHLSVPELDSVLQIEYTKLVVCDSNIEALLYELDAL